eukprot:4081322-Pyramimonas_sp.AAC.1
MIGCAPVGSEACLVRALMTIQLNTQAIGQELGEKLVQKRDRRDWSVVFWPRRVAAFPAGGCGRVRT